MIALMHYFWPVLAASVLIGVLTGAIAFRPMMASQERLMGDAASGQAGRRRRKALLAAGLLLTLAMTALWSGPLGAADRMANRVEMLARATLDYYELPQVQARLDRDPLSRRLVLSGPADDFQRRELVRIMDGLPGVGDVAWDPGSLESEQVR